MQSFNAFARGDPLRISGWAWYLQKLVSASARSSAFSWVQCPHPTPPHPLYSRRLRRHYSCAAPHILISPAPHTSISRCALWRRTIYSADRTDSHDSDSQPNWWRNHDRTGEETMIVGQTMWTQSTSHSPRVWQTDRRTDGRTDRQTELRWQRPRKA